jgi:hypothetical protein
MRDRFLNLAAAGYHHGDRGRASLRFALQNVSLGQKQPPRWRLELSPISGIWTKNSIRRYSARPNMRIRNFSPR